MKAIFVNVALRSNSGNSFSLETLRMSFGNEDAELNRILTSIPIRVGAGSAHFPIESASIPTLVTFLEAENSPGIRKQAARALANNPANREKIGKNANAINHLVACLDSSDIELKKIAARALAHLATNNRENKETIIDAYLSSKKDNKDFDFVRGLNNLIKKELKGWVSNYRTAINENLQLGQLGIKVCRPWIGNSVITQNQASDIRIIPIKGFRRTSNYLTKNK